MYVVIWGLVALGVLLGILCIASASAVTWMFLILAVILAILMIKRNMDLKKNIYKVPEDALHITNVQRGGVFSLSGVENQTGDITLKVLSKHLYTQGDYSWYELECDKGDGEKIWVEIEDDDDLIVSVVIREMSLHNVGLTPAMLTDFDDNETGSVRFNNKPYTYADSDSAVFYRHCDDAKPENLYYWDFENVSERKTLSVEKWGEKEYKVYLCQNMLPHQVTVYSTKTEGV